MSIRPIATFGARGRYWSNGRSQSVTPGGPVADRRAEAYVKVARDSGRAPAGSTSGDAAREIAREGIDRRHTAGAVDRFARNGTNG